MAARAHLADATTPIIRHTTDLIVVAGGGARALYDPWCRKGTRAPAWGGRFDAVFVKVAGVFDRILVNPVFPTDEPPASGIIVDLANTRDVEIRLLYRD